MLSPSRAANPTPYKTVRMRVASQTCLTALSVMGLMISAASAQGQDTGPPVYGVHDIELVDATQADEFEAVLRSAVLPAWKQPRDGMMMSILKGDRGERKGKYQLVYMFDSVQTRDRFFPTEGGGPSEDFGKVMSTVEESMSKLSQFGIQRESFTDYIPLGNYAPPTENSAFGVHNLESGDDFDTEAFDKFVKDKFAPAWKDYRKGFHFVITKGDRGERKGKYQLVYAFDSKETRDKYFPEEGGGGTEILGEVIEPAAAVMQELQQFPFTGSTYTDYLIVGAK